MRNIQSLQFINSTIDYAKKHSLAVKLIFFAVIYLFLRSGFQETIPFGFDHTKIANRVIDIIQTGDFFNVAQRILEHNIIEGVVSWGPFLLYMLVPVFLITRDPLIISNILIILQFAGIIFLYLAAEILYNKRVAFFSTLFVIVFPWSMIFSRMIYNPSLLITFVPLVMYVTLLIVKKGKQKLLLLLPALWTITVQFHFVSAPLVLISLGFIIADFKNISWRYFIVGCAFSLIPLAPIFASELNNNFAIMKNLLGSGDMEAKQTIGLFDTIAVILEKTRGYFLLDRWESFLGYAVKDFFSRLPFAYSVFYPFYTGLFFISVAFHVFYTFFKRKSEDVFLFLWLLSVPLFLVLINMNLDITEGLTSSQRYFIPAYFALAIVIGASIDRFAGFFTKKLKPGCEPGKLDRILRIVNYSASAVFVLFFGIFCVSYHLFIENYDYPRRGHLGWLSIDSSPPYKSTYNALLHALKEAKKEGFDTATISARPEINDSYDFANYTEYIWLQVFKKGRQKTAGAPFYFVVAGPVPTYLLSEDFRRFGAWRVYRKKPFITGGALYDIITKRPFNLISLKNTKALALIEQDGNRRIGLSDYNGESGQQFVLQKSNEAGFYYIVSASTEKRLEGSEDPFPVFREKSSSQAQKWWLMGNGTDIGILSRVTGLALAVDGENRIRLEKKTANTNQRWRILY